MIFITLVFLFPLFYLFVPMYIAYAINVITIIIAFIFLWEEDKKLVLIGVVFLIVNTWFLIRYVTTLQLLEQKLLFVDPIEVIRAESFGYVVTKFIQYLPLMILFFVAFGILYAWSFITQRGASTHRFAIIIGYVGIIVTLGLIFLDMYTFNPEAEGANFAVEAYEVQAWGRVFQVPFDTYYFYQISVWYISTFTFIVTFLGHLAGGSEE